MRRRKRWWRKKVYSMEEEEESVFKASAVNTEDSDRDRATLV